mmetsp:Transcript_53218/g.158621  ORF Transcript_53218/g.158621 Transcript_53218/m.158621 type:complete len:147 (+) Transcript_53218:55-495(+)
MASRTEFAAAGVAGLLAGALTFVSAVDARTLYKLASNGDETTLRNLFPIWWPNGRDLMLPLVLGTSSMHAAAFWVSNRKGWLATGAAILAIGPYTGLVLGEDIAALQKADSQEVCRTARHFSLLHHPRTVAAMLAYLTSLAFLRQN